MADALQATPASHLRVQIRHRIGATEIDVDFEITRPWTVLFGPSGSGKTTILRAIAGLLRPQDAKIVSGSGEPLADTQAGVWVPAHERRIPLTPQRPSLFPHLTVLENIGYGAHGRIGDGTDLTAQFAISHLHGKRPAELSGGEAQRVSLARAAMAHNSRLLLLDEPFTGLDLPLRDLLVANLLAWQKTHSIPILSVTHDVAEAFQLEAEVIKLAEGHVVEQGPVATVLANERARLLEQLSPSE